MTHAKLLEEIMEVKDCRVKQIGDFLIVSRTGDEVFSDRLRIFKKVVKFEEIAYDADYNDAANIIEEHNL